MKQEEAAELTRKLKKLEPSYPPLTICLDTFKHPYLQFDDEFVWPATSIDGVDGASAAIIVETLSRRLPGVVAGTSLLPHPRSSRDASELHFVREYRVGERSYIYLFKVSSHYMGGARDEELLSLARQGVGPSFRTSRLYFNARLLPVERVIREEGVVQGFEVLRMQDTINWMMEQPAHSLTHSFDHPESMSPNVDPLHVEKSADVWSNILFDDVDFSRLNERFTGLFTFGEEWKPKKLFYPFVVDFLTLALNLVDPGRRVAEVSLKHFHTLIRGITEKQAYLLERPEFLQFWRKYYNSWSYERFLSRSGNPHWRFLTTPSQKRS